MVKFGFIGLDDATETMCINLIENTNSMVYVYDPVYARSEYVATKGGVPCEVITDVVDRADIIFMRYMNPVDDQGAIYTIMGNLNHQNILIDMSPVSVELSQQFSEMIKDTGADYVDAPIIKGGTGLDDIKITLLYGGTSNTFMKVSDYLNTMADTVVRCGDNTSGICMYMCYSMMLAQIQNGVNEALVLATKNGIYITDFIKAIQNSPAQNSFVQEFGENMVKNNFPRNITINELNSALSMSKQYALNQGYDFKGLNLVNATYESAIDRKLKKHDITELYSIVKRSSFK